MTSLKRDADARGGGAQKWGAARRMLEPLVASCLAICAPGALGADVFSVAALETAVEQGDVRAMTQLASRYELGEGVAKNFLRSNYFYCSAARRGHAEAQYKLGGIYANGRGVERDHGIAAGLYARAAAQGHEHSQRLLQFMQEQLHVRAISELPACTQPETPLALRLSREFLPARAGAPR